MSLELNIRTIPPEHIDEGLELIWEVFQEFAEPDYTQKGIILP